MRIVQRFWRMWRLFLLLLLPFAAAAQDSIPQIPNGYSEIKLTATVDQQQIPKNRRVTYIAQLEWQGNLAAYEIIEVKNPAVENFEIIKNATAHRTEIANGQPMAIRKYEFTLQPLSLGMGYVGDILIRYRNHVTGEEQQLITNRLGVKVVDPLPEPGARILFLPKSMFYGLVFSLGLLLAAGFGFLKWKQSRTRIKQQRAAAEMIKPVEHTYLTHLKSTMDLRSQEVVSQFSEISRIFRQYLAEKFRIQILDKTTSNIILLLRSVNDDEKFLADTSEILNTCDLAKFSGGGLGNAELARVYTLTESMLEKFSATQNPLPTVEKK
ncbi:hypothetical protein L0128_05915 [candidate division KSB1 bacterium]|nr:hypothetical protein [candidate division KSB1 bacterium]